jgi:hypothetical protein
MWYDRAEWQSGPRCQEERQLVDVLNQNVRALRRDGALHRTAPNEGEAVPPPNALDADAVDGRCWRGPAPARADHPHPVAPRGQPAENLEQVDLRSPRMRVGAVLPVDEKDVHEEESKECGRRDARAGFYSRPSECATPSRMPLTKPGARAPPNQ